MFKIKTKKDIKIEELEKEIERLTQILKSPLGKPQIIRCERNITTLRTCRILEEDMPIEHAKYLISREFVEQLEPYIHFDISEDKSDYRKKTMIGLLQVVENRRFW